MQDFTILPQGPSGELRIKRNDFMARAGGPAGSSSSNGTTSSSSGSGTFEQHDGALTEHLRKKGDVLVSNSPDGIYRGFVPEEVLTHKLDNGLQALYRTPADLLSTIATRPGIVIRYPRHGGAYSKVDFVVDALRFDAFPPDPRNVSSGPFICLEVLLKEQPLWRKCFDSQRRDFFNVTVRAVMDMDGWYTATAYLWPTNLDPHEPQHWSGFSFSPVRASSTFMFVDQVYIKSKYMRHPEPERWPLIAHTHSAVIRARQDSSRLTEEVLGLDGMSGSQTRHFLNNLLDWPGARYLEVGMWKGSTFCSALWDNAHRLELAVGIDDWSQFLGPRLDFMDNLARCSGGYDTNRSVRILDEDMLKAADQLMQEPGLVGSFNFYFFDGPHETRDQYVALTRFYPLLAETSVVLVDDWNQAPVRLGTEAALQDLGALGLQVVYRMEIETTAGSEQLWHNGFGIFVLHKGPPPLPRTWPPHDQDDHPQPPPTAQEEEGGAAAAI